MMISRRAVLGAALTGGAIAAAGTLPAWATDADGMAAAPVEAPRLLVDSAMPAAFAEAATAALTASGLGGGGTVVIDGDGTAALAASAAWLAARPGRRLVGLVKDADGILFHQFARTDRTHWLSIGHHGQSEELAFQSRHRIVGLSFNRGLARTLAADLAASSADFTVTDQPMMDHAGPVAAPFAVRSDTPAAARGWETTLGETLGWIAAGRWPAHPPEPGQTFSGRGIRDATRTFAVTSFVIAS
jgi:hypothetical protein